MKKKKDSSNKVIVMVFALVVMVFLGFILKTEMRQENNKEEKPKEKKVVINTGEFNIDIIKNVNGRTNNNYLVSPYNIEVALNLLREGADGNTKLEIDKVIGNRAINDVSVKAKVEIANALFIKDDYKKDVKGDFTSTLKNKYQSEVIYDEYKTPKVINDWVKENTNGMIDGVVDQISSDFMLGLASALAIDVKWQSEFECEATRSAEFTKLDNSKMNTEMMHQVYEYGAEYFKNDEVEGIILPYLKEVNSDVELEFVGIIPNGDVSDYVNNLTNEKLNNIFNNTKSASSNLHVHLSLPRFTYDYEVEEFNSVLSDLGIKEAFNPLSANFKKIIDVPDKNLYVSTAIHKTKIELNETGTKAAAVTFFGMDGATALLEKDWEDVYVTFNKPFVYLIREKNTNEMLFFGVVYEPNEWKGSTCSN